MSCTTTCVQPSPSNAHCSTCHRTFGTASSFDRHRRGGECLDPAALRMHADGRGVWRMDGHAASAFFRSPQAAEDGSVVPPPRVATPEAAETITGGDAPDRDPDTDAMIATQEWDAHEHNQEQP